MSDELDLAALISALDDHRVDYVVAGSVAAMAHGTPDVTPSDLDIVPNTHPANLARLADALRELNAVAAIETGEWQTDAAGEHRWVEDGIERQPRQLDPQEPATFDHSFATVAGRLDVIPRIAGLHADLHSRASRLPIAGRQAWSASPIDILAGMTGPRRAKDGPRVRHLRTVVAAAGARSGVGFVGFRTDRFDEMVNLFRGIIGLEVVREVPGATWFRLGTDAELHVYANTAADHAFFTTGPVVGLRVEDVEATRAQLEAEGLDMLTDVERSAAAAWCHFRAPDGTVLEIIGPASPLFATQRS